MKNIIKSLLILISFFLIQACSLDVDEIVTSKILDSISVDSSKAKKTYYIGEEIDNSNIIVYACYTNGSKEKLPELDKTNFEFDTTDEQQIKIKVSYIGKTDSFPITISKKPLTGITIEKYPTKRIYSMDDITSENYKKDIISADESEYGIVVRECYTDGSIGDEIKPLDDDNPFGYELSVSNSSLSNNRSVIVTVSFENLKAEFDIFINDEVSQNPENYNFTASLTDDNIYYNFKIDKIDSAHILAYCKSKINENVIIQIPSYCLNFEDITELEEPDLYHTVPVSISKELNTTITNVKIIGKLDGLNLEKKSNSEKKYYYVGDAFDTNTISVYETWELYKNEDGSSKNGTEITDYTVTPSKFSKSGLNTVTISYKGYTKTSDVFVNNKITKLQINNTSVTIPLGESLKDYIEWDISGILNNGNSIELNNEDCNFEYRGTVENPGEYQVKVSFGTYSCFYADDNETLEEVESISTEVPVTVIEPELDGLSVSLNNNKVYSIKDSFDPSSDLIVKPIWETYKGTYKETISCNVTDGYTYSCSNSNLIDEKFTKNGDYEFTISYKGKSTSIILKAQHKLTNVKISPKYEKYENGIPLGVDLNDNKYISWTATATYDDNDAGNLIDTESLSFTWLTDKDKSEPTKEGTYWLNVSFNLEGESCERYSSVQLEVIEPELLGYYVKFSYKDTLTGIPYGIELSNGSYFNYNVYKVDTSNIKDCKYINESPSNTGFSINWASDSPGIGSKTVTVTKDSKEITSFYDESGNYIGNKLSVNVISNQIKDVSLEIDGVGVTISNSKVSIKSGNHKLKFIIERNFDKYNIEYEQSFSSKEEGKFSFDNDGTDNYIIYFYCN